MIPREGRRVAGMRGGAGLAPREEGKLAGSYPAKPRDQLTALVYTPPYPLIGCITKNV
jgi:hypothetical protein